MVLAMHEKRSALRVNLYYRKPSTLVDIPVTVNSVKAPVGDYTFTYREAQVLHCMTLAMPCKAIAKLLDLSPRTIEIYALRVKHKLGARTWSAAAVIAIITGLVDPEWVKARLVQEIPNEYEHLYEEQQ